MAKGVEAYNVKTKKKTIMKDVVISVNANGRYFAKGVSAEKDGTKMCAAMGEDKAWEAVDKGWATKGEGWPKNKMKK